MATAYSGQGGFGGDFFAMFKQVFNERRVKVQTFNRRPFMKALDFKDDFVGSTYDLTVGFEDPQGGSADFATAMNQGQYTGANNAPATQAVRFIINRGREYQSIQMLNEEIQASKNDIGALLKKKTREQNGVLNEMSRRMDIALHNDGTGIIASFTTGSSVAVNTITLDTPQLGIRFSVGMYLQVATVRPTNGIIPAGFFLSTTPVKVTGVSRSALQGQSTLQISANLSTLGAAANTQYFLLRNGEALGFGQNNIYGGVSGLRSWFPLALPVAGDSFWGVDRSQDTQRLSGSRYIGSNGEKYESTFQNASAELCNQESNPGVVLANPLDLNKYSQELGNKVRYEEVSDAKTGLKTKGTIVQGQSGDMIAFADPQVDPGLFYMLDMSTMWCKHLDAVPHLIDSDGNSALRDTTNTRDAIQMGWRAWYQLVCDEPGKNLVGTFAP